MILRQAVVCYCASDGYLLQTFVSARQARANVDADVRVVIIRIGDARSTEADAFRGACESAGIEFVEAPSAVLGGLGFYYARLFLDELVPGETDRLLYIDGDTQILGSLMPLLHASPPTGGLLAVRDPTVLYAQASARFARDAHALWDANGIPGAVRPRYINSGVLMVTMRDLADIRRQALDARERRGRDSGYPEQDLLNIVIADRIATVSPAWNFPGFLLGTRIEDAVDPVIVHFMSDPRPWRAPYRGWREFHHAYWDAVREHPDLAPFFARAGVVERARYRVQTAFKAVNETRHWQASRASEYSWVRNVDLAV